MIRFNKVGLRYNVGPEILQDISFHIPPASFHFLTGPSGSGKTSLLRLIFLTLKPTRGLIHLFGHDASLLNANQHAILRQNMGIIFQDFQLLSHLTIYENIALPLRLRGREERSYRAEIHEILQWVGLGMHIYSYPELLSGGEKQRAAIARALIIRPKILLADEPTGNVDPPLAKRLLRLFLELNHSGTTVIIATHDFHLIEQIPARKLILKDKKLLAYEQ